MIASGTPLIGDEYVDASLIKNLGLGEFSNADSF